MSNTFDAVEYREVSFKGSVYNFSVNYKVIDISDVLHIHKYLIATNDIEQCSGSINNCYSII